LYIWATTLGVSVVEMPRANWTRILLLGWLLAFLVLSAAYQGALFSFLAKPRYQRALDTLEDIVLHELPIIAHPNFNNFLETGDAEISAKALR
jgi:Ligand-gated ion channel